MGKLQTNGSREEVRSNAHKRITSAGRESQSNHVDKIKYSVNVS